MNENRPITLQDVAERAGVGLSTASYVLNNKPKSIGNEARQRILRAAQEMGYRPNMSARSLVTRKTHIVALWVPNVASAFSGSVIAEIQKLARHNGYEVMICDAERNYNEAGSNENTLATTTLQMPLWNVDGIIAFFGSSSRGIEQEFQSKPLLPFVSMGSFSVPDTDYVALSLLKASQEAVRWLLAQGCQRVGFLVPIEADFIGDERHDAYIEAMSIKGQQPLFIYMKQNTRASAYEATRDYLKANESVDALFCYNDYAAIGASRALREAGLSIPAQVLLVGCDGIEDRDYLEWPLHTIELPIQAMCEAAWKFLEQRLTAPTLPHQTQSFAGRFALRNP